MIIHKFLTLSVLVALLPAAIDGQEVRGSVALEARTFPFSSQFERQRDATLSPSILFAPELLGDALDGDLQLTLQPLLRLDGHDGNRTHFDLREASALYFANGWTLFAGVGKVFWGKTEAHHLVDIVNQSIRSDLDYRRTDGVEDVDTEDNCWRGTRRGQPMSGSMRLTLERGRGAAATGGDRGGAEGSGGRQGLPLEPDDDGCAGPRAAYVSEPNRGRRKWKRNRDAQKPT